MCYVCTIWTHDSHYCRKCFCVTVARSTVSKCNVRVMEAIVDKLDIPPFPLNDEQRLEELAQGFRAKSCGQLFGNVIGAFDGYLL